MRRALALTLTLLFTGCDHPFFTLLWQTYEHPTYRFKMRFPRSWLLKQDDILAVAVSATSKDPSEIFKTNVNLVVQSLSQPTPLNTLVETSKAQLKIIFNQYSLLGQAKSRIGPLEGIELRGRYFALEGTRIVRSIVAVHNQTQYILTFTVSEELEKKYVDQFDAIRENFELETNL